MQIKSFKELADAARAQEKKSCLAVAAANDAHTVEAVVSAYKEGIAEAILVGDEHLVVQHIEELGADPRDYTIVHAVSVEDSLKAAVDLINAGKANVFMKGNVETSDFVRAIVSRENGLRKAPLLSNAGFFEVSSYHKLLVISDQAINVYPDLEAKKTIIENAVHLLHACGVEQPKVAVLAAVEKVNPKMKETVDADELKSMNIEGVISGCIVDGPLSLDIATSKEAAEIKGYKSEVAGDADLLIVPDLISGNVLSKSLTGFAGAVTAGAVVGAKVPVVLTPRSAGASDKFYSIALAAYTAQQY